MKILFYSPTWWPNVGGIEDIGHGVASGLVGLGHQVTVVTPTPSTKERDAAYKVVRNPSWSDARKLVKSHDIVHSNGIAMKLLPVALLERKPFTWTYHGYQLLCLDGAGWSDGEPAPMEPWASFCHHLGSKPTYAITGGIKLALRRLASNVVSANIASSKHLAFRQRASRISTIFNPYDAAVYGLNTFEEAEKQLDKAEPTFTYIGRLITEKGVDDLLHAVAQILVKEESETEKRTVTLKVIGDGPEKQNLALMARELGISDRVFFLGSKTGVELKREVAKSGICVVPSAWEEPGALIVLNLMAAGKPLIVSQTGWLSEAAGNAALTFPNSDREALLEAMEKLRRDRDLQLQLIRRGLKRMESYLPEDSAKAYADLFQSLVRGSKRSGSGSVASASAAS